MDIIYIYMRIDFAIEKYVTKSLNNLIRQETNGNESLVKKNLKSEEQNIALFISHVKRYLLK